MTAARSRSQSKRPGRPTRMPARFNVFRAGIYGAVLIWSIICLAVAAHFMTLLVSSDLTHFVPFAIFVCTASLLIFLSLLGFTLRRHLNPISTRVELACLALTGILWLALGAFLATSESQEADVECFASDATTEAIDVPGFSTEIFHAQYHVLEAFSLLNAILIFVFFFTLLFLALREHRNGKTDVWYIPVPSYPWFGARRRKRAKSLPSPALARGRTRSNSRPGPYHEKSGYRQPHRPPVAHATGGRDKQDKYLRGASPRR